MVCSGGNCCKNFFLRSKRKVNGIRRPSSDGAIARYVRGACELTSLLSAFDEDDGESAM